MGHATMQIPVYTDSRGNGFIMIFPEALASPYLGQRKVVNQPVHGHVVNGGYGIQTWANTTAKP